MDSNVLILQTRTRSPERQSDLPRASSKRVGESPPPQGMSHRLKRATGSAPLTRFAHQEHAGAGTTQGRLPRPSL